jgi:hypothetical protein
VIVKEGKPKHVVVILQLDVLQPLRIAPARNYRFLQCYSAKAQPPVNMIAWSV